MPTLQEAFLIVGENIPLADPAIKVRFDRAYEIVRQLGSGYTISETQKGVYKVQRASTTLLEDNSAEYTTTVKECTCPDYEKVRAGLCKHRLAIMLIKAMAKKG